MAPVVVVPDATGSQFGDPLCVDSRRGNADTYLAKDVPAWSKPISASIPTRKVGRSPVFPSFVCDFCIVYLTSFRRASFFLLNRSEA